MNLKSLVRDFSCASLSIIYPSVLPMWGYRWNKLMQEELWRNMPTLEWRWMIGRNFFEDYQSYFFQQLAQAQPHQACVKDGLGQVLLLWLFLWKHSVGSASVKTKVSNRKSSKTTTAKKAVCCAWALDTPALWIDWSVSQTQNDLYCMRLLLTLLPI